MVKYKVVINITNRWLPDEHTSLDMSTGTFKKTLVPIINIHAKLADFIYYKSEVLAKY